MQATPYAPPAIEGPKRLIQEDEFAAILVIVLLFIVRVWSVAALDRAIQRCYDVGGYPEVSTGFMGSSWKVKCLRTS